MSDDLERARRRRQGVEVEWTAEAEDALARARESFDEPVLVYESDGALGGCVVCAVSGALVASVFWAAAWGIWG